MISRPLLAFLLLAGAAVSIPSPGPATCTDPARLAERLLGSPDPGELFLEARTALSFEDGVGRARVELALEATEEGRLCMAVVGLTEDGFRTLARRELDVPPDAGPVRLLLDLELPPTVEELLAVGERPAAGSWAALPIEESVGRLEPGPAARVLSGGAPGSSAWLELGQGGAGGTTAGPPADAAPVIRLVPPTERPVRGTARFDALPTTDAVERVVFLVDGRETARDGVRPFAARLELDDPPRQQRVEVVAYDGQDRELGRDARDLNVGEGAFRLRLVDLGSGPDGNRRVRATAEIPPGRRLEEVEIRRGDQVVATGRTNPFEAPVGPASDDPADFVVAVARLDDGQRIEEALLLAGGSGEQIEVNLVELRAVVVGADGRPVPDLPREAFRVRLGDRQLAVERFSWADDVPLLAGLIVDTSGSMQLVMHDTRRAAARFLGRTLLEGDRGFVVDFDRNPRLLQPVTGDVVRLLESLRALEARGATAMYDAIRFSLVQIEDAPGRPALVVLTDGDDRDSTWGPKDTIEAARRLGTPVYLIALGALDDIPRSYPERELRRLADQTGGRFFLVDDFAQLDAAYDTIAAELRNQYVLGVYTEDELQPAELRELRLEVDGGLEVRLAVAATR